MKRITWVASYNFPLKKISELWDKDMFKSIKDCDSGYIVNKSQQTFLENLHILYKGRVEWDIETSILLNYSSLNGNTLKFRSS